jgi:hypothetical protein
VAGQTGKGNAKGQGRTHGIGIKVRGSGMVLREMRGRSILLPLKKHLTLRDGLDELRLVMKDKPEEFSKLK